MGPFFLLLGSARLPHTIQTCFLPLCAQFSLLLHRSAPPPLLPISGVNHPATAAAAGATAQPLPASAGDDAGGVASSEARPGGYRGGGHVSPPSPFFARPRRRCRDGRPLARSHR